MPLPLASLAVTGGQTYAVSVGSRGTVGAVVIANESPYSLQVSTGSGGLWIVAQTADLVPCDSTAFNGNLTITTDNYLSNAANAPSFLVYMTAYAPGEAIRGTYPAPLVRLANGGAAVTVASSVVNDNNAPGTNVLEATPAGSVDSYALIRNDGTVDFKAISQNVETDILHLTPGSVSLAAKLAVRLLYGIGVTQLDSGKISTDGLGDVTAVSLIAQSAINPFLTVNPTSITVTSNAIPGTYQGMTVFVWENGASLPILDLGTNQNSGQVVHISGAGIITANAPVTLAAGNQETDGCGRIFQAAAANEGDGYYVPFKCHMTNVPTSITLTVSSSGNVKAGTPTATNITRDGFLFFVEAAGAGVCSWQGTYTTVGN